MIAIVLRRLFPGRFVIDQGAGNRISMKFLTDKQFGNFITILNEIRTVFPVLSLKYVCLEFTQLTQPAVNSH